MTDRLTWAEVCAWRLRATGWRLYRAGALAATPAPPSSLSEEARLTPAQFDSVVDAVSAALHGAELTIDELDIAVITATGSWAGDPVVPAFGGWWPRWRQAIAVAAHRAMLCFGPARGRRVTYADPAAWLPGFRPDDGRVAAAELVCRFLYAYGPATPYQFARWFGAPRPWAVELFASVEHRLRIATIEESARGGNPRGGNPGPGDVAWILATDTSLDPPMATGVRLLPYFDSYTVGCHPRELLFPGAAATRALTQGQAGTYPVVVVDGTVAGMWHHRTSGRRIHIVVEPFGRLSAPRRRELDDQVTRDPGRKAGTDDRRSDGRRPQITAAVGVTAAARAPTFRRTLESSCR